MYRIFKKQIILTAFSDSEREKKRFYLMSPYSEKGEAGLSVVNFTFHYGYFFHNVNIRIYLFFRRVYIKFRTDGSPRRMHYLSVLLMQSGFSTCVYLSLTCLLTSLQRSNSAIVSSIKCMDR